MEEIKVGEYVKFYNGKISKVIDVCLASEYRKQFEKPNKLLNYIKDKYYFDNRQGCWTDSTIKKHSKAIIDLIEKDDYVNGKRVLVVDDIITDNGGKAILVENYDEWTDDGVITNKDIKSIVTHEQFARIEYKVEE